MAIQKLVEVLDGKNILKNNIEFLKKKTHEVRLPLSDTNKQILIDLLDTYKVTPCAGIAANQIGHDKRIFIGLKEDVDEEVEEKQEIIGNPNANNYEFYINPQIDHTSKKSIQEGEEGCLSIPEVRLITERFDKIKVRYYNEEGKKIKKPLKGFLSKLFQHELDHLDGVLMVESKKIKKVYQITDNKNIQMLYKYLMEALD